ncbi:NAD(P)-binding protein [Cadophora sp. DSE1049]|nr:NAD(P)-binding protein [Cadophora sp. DSE1049]
MSLATIRNLRNQWFPPKPQFTEKNVTSQKGKVFIVTGGNTGVGYALIKLLYGTGATIYMASRNKEKALAAITLLQSTTPAPSTPATLKFLHLDLSDLLSVKAAATTFASRETRLDILWNNAAVGATKVQLGDRTAQGFEPTIGANGIGTLLFTTLLVLQLRAASASVLGGQARVVWTSSYMAEGITPTNGIDFSLLDTGTSSLVKNYAISKAGTWILCREFARRYGVGQADVEGGAGIISVIQNPGNLQTGGYDDVSALTMFFVKPLLHEAKFGAYTELFAGLAEGVENGAYVVPWGRVRPDAESPRKDILNAMKTIEEGGLGYGKKFWEWCEGKWRPLV